MSVQYVPLSNERFGRKVQNKRKGAKKFGEDNKLTNKKGRERYTHYPVPSEVKVSQKLEFTSGVDMILYSHAPGHEKEQKHRINISDHFRCEKVSHLRLWSTCVDAFFLLPRR
jgi:hypothetical protein